jgi:hypothetical protein
MSDYHYIQASAVETEYMTYIWNAFSREHVQYSTEVNDMHAWSCTLQPVPWKWSCAWLRALTELIQKKHVRDTGYLTAVVPRPLWLAGETIFSDRSRFTDRRRSTTHVTYTSGSTASDPSCPCMCAYTGDADVESKAITSLHVMMCLFGYVRTCNLSLLFPTVCTVIIRLLL